MAVSSFTKSYTPFLVLLMVIDTGCVKKTEWLNGKYWSMEFGRDEYIEINFDSLTYKHKYVTKDSTYFQEGAFYFDKERRQVTVNRFISWADGDSTLSSIQFSYTAGILSLGEEVKSSYAMDGYNFGIGF